jgi:hypothetical protein
MDLPVVVATLFEDVTQEPKLGLQAVFNTEIWTCAPVDG